MAQPAALQISQATVGTGSVGEAWTGGDSSDAGGGLANVVSVENTAPVTGDTQVSLFWVPHDGAGVKLDVAGEGNLAQDGGNPHLWTFQPTALVWGKWIIRAQEVGQPAEYRVFGIVSPVHGLLEPGFNEIADAYLSGLIDPSLMASLLNATQDNIDAGWDNEGQTLNGWQKNIRKLIEIVETLGGGGGGGFVEGETWEFDAATADADPGAGKFRFDNATQSLATLAFINFAAINGAPTAVASGLALMNAGDQLLIEQQDDGSKWGVYVQTAPDTIAGGYVKKAVAAVGNGAAIDAGANCTFRIFKP